MVFFFLPLLSPLMINKLPCRKNPFESCQPVCVMYAYFLMMSHFRIHDRSLSYSHTFGARNIRLKSKEFAGCELSNPLSYLESPILYYIQSRGPQENEKVFYYDCSISLNPKLSNDEALIKKNVNSSLY